MARRLDDSALTSQKLVEFAQWRMSEEGGGVQAQTVGNDLSHLGAVLSVARPAWGYEFDPLAMPDARKVLRKLGMVSKSKERNRRPTLEELDKLMAHFFEMQERRKAQIDMPKVIAFALFSTRRQEEITPVRHTPTKSQHRSEKERPVRMCVDHIDRCSSDVTVKVRAMDDVVLSEKIKREADRFLVPSDSMIVAVNTGRGRMVCSKH